MKIKFQRINIHNLTTTYFLFGIFILLAIMIFLIKDPLHLIRSDKKSPFIEKVTKDKIARLDVNISNKKQVIKKRGDVWVVESAGNAPANNQAVEEIVQSCLTLKREALVSKNAENQASFNVDEKGIHVTLYGEDDKIAADFYIGKNGPDFLSTYIRKEGENFVYLYPENLRTAFNQEDLRNLEILALPKDSLQKIQGEENGNAVTLEKQEKGWKVVAPLEVELTEEAVSPLLTLLANFTAKDVRMDLKDEEAGFLTPRKSILLTTKDASYTLKVGNKTTSDDKETPTYYLKLEGDPRILIITEENMKTLPSRIADLEAPEPVK